MSGLRIVVGADDAGRPARGAEDASSSPRTSRKTAAATSAVENGVTEND